MRPFIYEPHNDLFFERIRQLDEVNAKFRNGQIFDSEVSSVIKGLEFSDMELQSMGVFGLIFEDCTFNQVVFSSIEFREMFFENCTFESCAFEESNFHGITFSKTNFRSCLINDTHFVHTTFYNIKFEFCPQLLRVNFTHSQLSGFDFEKCSLEWVNFYQHSMLGIKWLENAHWIKESKPENLEYPPEMSIKDCMINCTSFVQSDLRFLRIRNSHLSTIYFSNSILSRQTIDQSNIQRENYECGLDFMSILRSHNLEPEVLKRFFSIDDAQIRSKIYAMTSYPRYQSVFISYSFKDREFAQKLRESLLAKGVAVWFWESDALGGRKLRSVMREKVKEYDRILFIASENSIKSRACHFELTQARKRQAKTWKTVLFPIHIDEFLFELNEDEILDMEYKDEIWKNVTELRELSSIEFSIGMEESDFEKTLEKVLASIKTTD